MDARFTRITISGISGDRNATRAREDEMVDQVKEEICRRIADGESLRAICRDDRMPATSTVCLWLADDETFREQYARARELQADALFDEILEISDRAEKDYRVDDEGRLTVDSENIQRAKLMVDSRKWMAAKLRPKKYGDASTLKLTDGDGGKVLSPTDIEAAVMSIIAKAAERDAGAN